MAVGLGSDGIRDLWSPWGDGDLLAGAALLDLSAYGLTPGCAADLSLVSATTLGEAVVTTHPGPWSSGPAASCDRHDNTDPAHVPCLLRRPP